MYLTYCVGIGHRSVIKKSRITGLFSVAAHFTLTLRPCEIGACRVHALRVNVWKKAEKAKVVSFFGSHFSLSWGVRNINIIARVSLWYSNYFGDETVATYEYEGNQNELPTKMFCVALSFLQMISSGSVIYLWLMSKSETFSSTLLSPCSCEISGKLQNETLANSQESFVFVLQVCCYCHCCASRELSETFTLRRPTRNCCDFIFYPFYIFEPRYFLDF